MAKNNYKQILIEVISGGYDHIRAINAEITRMNIKDPKDAPQHDQDKLRALTLTMTLVNDLIHPAHKISRELLKDKVPFIDYCENMQKIAFETKLVDPCKCSSCIKVE